MGSVLRLIGFAIAFIIVIGIALVALHANEDNGLVAAWLDIARFFVGPFKGIFDLDSGKEELQTAINWGIAAIVYLLVFSLLARLAGRARRPTFGRRRRRPAH
jgi:hypothetical protein